MRRFLHTLMVLTMIIAGAPVLGSTAIPGGNVSGTWTAAGSPYLIEGDINVAAADLLAIGPGVEVNFQGPYRLTVEGELQAAGALQDSVIFTAADPETGWKGIYIPSTAGPVLLDYCTVEHGTGALSDNCGGGIACQSPHLTVTHCRFSGNRASYGGGLYISIFATEGTTTVSDCTISHNEAQVVGGGIYYSGPRIVLTRCLIESNHSTGANGGGGAYCDGMFLGSVEISECMFTNNKTLNGGGGAGLKVTGRCGGGVTLEDCDFLANLDIRTGDGGGICLAGADGGTTVTNCRFLENHCWGGRGGGLYADSGALTVSYCTFAHNFSANGGTLTITSQADLTLESCSFSHNYDNVWFGTGALFLDSDAVVLNTIIANQWSNGGFGVAGISFQSGTHTVRHSDFFNDGNDLDFVGTIPAGLGTLTTVNANGDSCDTFNNIFLNPRLCDAPAGDLSIAELSPCLGAGVAGANIGALGIGCELSPVPEHLFMGCGMLTQNYPNPFNPSTTIRYGLPENATVYLRIYDVSGRLVRTLVNGEVIAGGSREVVWRGNDDAGRPVSTGVYFYRLEAGSYSETKKMVLAK